jgi:thiamine pyrophosphokinase
MKDFSGRTVIIADGTFPFHEIPLTCLEKASRVVCCDGAAETLISKGFIPDAIAGDLDSLMKETAERFSDRLFQDKDQETNDLTKAVLWCRSRGIKEIVILGATGKREDHTIGNISLLSEYAYYIDVIMITDTGIFVPYTRSFKAETFAGQQISIFSTNSETVISSSGLRYALEEKRMNNWWIGTLNEALGDHFELAFTGGPVIIFLKFPD